MDDDELIERIRLGDEAAAESLIRRYYAAILRYCAHRCGSGQRAEDLTQETFLRLFRSLPGYTGKRKFRAYLYTIAERLCIDESRRPRPCPLEEQRLIKEYDEIRQAEDREELARLLAALPPEQRTAVLLRYGERLSFREIGSVMGCSLRTAQSRVRWALKRMRQVKDDGG